MLLLWIKKWKWVVLGSIALVTSGIGVAYHRHMTQLRVARAELRAEYSQLMRDGMREHYILYGRLPSTADEIAVGNPMFRSPERIDRAIELEGDNYASLAECILALEARALVDALPIAPTELEEWEREFQRIQEIVDQAGDTESKLRLAANPEVDTAAGLRHAVELLESDSVSEELVNNYLSAASELRGLRLNLPTGAQRELLRQGFLSQIDSPEEPEIEAAEARFEEALKLLLESLANKSLNRSGG